MRLIVSAAALVMVSSAALADCNHPVMIGAAPGARESTIDNDSPTATIDCYQFVANAGQQVSVDIAGAKGDAVFAIFAPGWQATCDALDDCDVIGDQLTDDQVRSWSDKVAVAGTYLIVVDNSRSDLEYRLNVEFR
jgi:hypothetical protein